jgi:hypothetical protein
MVHQHDPGSERESRLPRGLDLNEAAGSRNFILMSGFVPAKPTEAHLARSWPRSLAALFRTSILLGVATSPHPLPNGARVESEPGLVARPSRIADCGGRRAVCERSKFARRRTCPEQGRRSRLHGAGHPKGHATATMVLGPFAETKGPRLPGRNPAFPITAWTK